MGTHIRKTKQGFWEVYYTEEDGSKHFVALDETKDKMIHKLLRIIKRQDGYSS